MSDNLCSWSSVIHRFFALSSLSMSQTLPTYILKTVVLFCVYNLKRSIKCADNKTNTKRTTTKTKKRRSRSRMRSEVGLNPFFIALIISLYGQAIKPSNSHRAAHPFGIICRQPPTPSALLSRSHILHISWSALLCLLLLPSCLFVFCHKERVDLDSKSKWVGIGRREREREEKESTRQSKAGTKGGCCVCKSFRRFDWLINQLGFNGGYKGYKAEQQ